MAEGTNYQANYGLEDSGESQCKGSGTERAKATLGVQRERRETSSVARAPGKRTSYANCSPISIGNALGRRVAMSSRRRESVSS